MSLDVVGDTGSFSPKSSGIGHDGLKTLPRALTTRTLPESTGQQLSQHSRASTIRLIIVCLNIPTVALFKNSHRIMKHKEPRSISIIWNPAHFQMGTSAPIKQSLWCEKHPSTENSAPIHISSPQGCPVPCFCGENKLAINLMLRGKNKTPHQKIYLVSIIDFQLLNIQIVSDWFNLAKMFFVDKHGSQKPRLCLKHK